MECIRLGTQSPLTGYYASKCRCPECRKAMTDYRREWMERPGVRENRREWLKGNNKPRRDMVIAARAGGCAECGETDERCLDFHHTDPASKDFTCSSAHMNRSLEALAAEIAKCVVLCANCHRKLHRPLAL